MFLFLFRFFIREQKPFNTKKDTVNSSFTLYQGISPLNIKAKESKYYNLAEFIKKETLEMIVIPKRLFNYPLPLSNQSGLPTMEIPVIPIQPEHPKNCKTKKQKKLVSAINLTPTKLRLLNP